MRVCHRTTRRTNLRCFSKRDSDFWNLSKGIFSVALARNLQTMRSNASCSDGREVKGGEREYNSAFLLCFMKYKPEDTSLYKSNKILTMIA